MTEITVSEPPLRRIFHVKNSFRVNCNQNWQPVKYRQSVSYNKINNFHHDDCLVVKGLLYWKNYVENLCYVEVMWLVWKQ